MNTDLAIAEEMKSYCPEKLLQSLLTILESNIGSATSEVIKLEPEKQPCRHFSLAEIKSATQDFNDSLIIGRGGFGKVYKGQIKNGITGITFAAIKRLDSRSNQGAPEFWVEIEMLSKLRHCNLVSLIGYCDDKPEMILVYEYVPLGTLGNHLHNDTSSLSWLQRLKICIGAAHGLDYLHNGTDTQHGVIHRDVKSSNILLDENLDAKISDFGLSKIGPTNESHTYVSTAVKGTFGYLDPEYFSTGRLTRKSDVYAFGVVLFEALCGRRAVDTTLQEEQWGLAGWVQDCIKKGKLDKIIDSSLRGQISTESLKEFTRIAGSCLHNSSKQRPTMAEVVGKLERSLFLQERMSLSANKGNFIGKIRLLFSAKSDLKLDSNPVPLATKVDSPARVFKAKAELVLLDSTYVFTVEDLLLSSAELIYKGIYWTSYTAYIEEYGYQVSLKRKNEVVPFKIEENEFAALGKVCHPNILALKGYYWSHDEKLCLYEYMPNGSVASLLQSRKTRSSIKWQGRVNIMTGIARGLWYLHTMENIVHGNLTSSKIFLDKYYNPVISDVGLLPLVNTGANTRTGNHAPEFLEGEFANRATDVYSLGVIMLELLTGNSTGKGSYMPDLPQWVNVKMREQSDVLFDFELRKRETNVEDELLQTLNLAMLCIQATPTDRPNAQQVLQKLEEIKPARGASI